MSYYKRSGANYVHEPYDVALARAEEEGYEIVYPKDDELLIDLDSKEQHDKFYRDLSLLQSYFVAYVTKDAPSKTPGHRHVTVKVDRPLTILERIALQAALGSDNRREIHSLIDHFNGLDRPSLFFERKDETAQNEVTLQPSQYAEGQPESMDSAQLAGVLPSGEAGNQA